MKYLSNDDASFHELFVMVRGVSVHVTVAVSSSCTDVNGDNLKMTVKCQRCSGNVNDDDDV